MDLTDDDLPGRRHLAHAEVRAEVVIRAGVGPVAQLAVGVGFAQLGAWVGCVRGGGAIHRHPEEQAV
ncbi:hypothetical protein D3C78_1861610 [compost metagenome]